MEQEDNLDPMQKKAVKWAVTHELGLVQGGPGTGKSRVGGAIVQTLLKLKRQFGLFEGPIYLICYTNHGLDQFMEQIETHTDRMLRLGGRSKKADFEK